MENNNELVQLEEFRSEESSSESEEEVININKTRRTRSWVSLEVYENKELVKEWLKLNKFWSLDKSYETEAGRKVFYRCNLVKKRGPQCEKKMHLQYNSENLNIIRFETTTNHTHEDILINQKKQGINQETKEAIKKQLSLGVRKRKTIIENLKTEALSNPNIIIPTDRQFSNLIQAIKPSNHMNLDFAELIRLLSQYENIPDNMDEPFIFYQIKLDKYSNENNPKHKFLSVKIDNESFRFFITTKRLLSFVETALVLQADSTYKLIWNGFPVLICGTSDKDKVFHPFGIAVTTNEKEEDFQFMFECLQVGLEFTNKTQLPNDGTIALLADAADAITNGFKAVFSPDKSDFKRKMCWFHMKKAVEKYLAVLNDKKLKEEILKNIDILQLSTSEELFNVATKLFIAKYKISTNVNIKVFLDYFNKEWLIQHFGWYEGYLPDSPSTNNGLESINGTLKKEATFRERMQMAPFIETSIDLVRKWSIKRDPLSNNNPKIFATDPSIGTKEFTNAYNWLKETKIIERKSHGNKFFYFSSKQAVNEVNCTAIKQYCDALKTLKLKSFEEYRSIFFSTWEASFPENATNWKKSAKCSCPYFQKNYICKHLIGLAARFKLITIPNEAKNVPLGEKRKKGRPTLARKALEHQPTTSAVAIAEEEEVEVEPPPPKKRGRKPKQNL